VVEGLDWRSLEVTTRLNGTVKQHGKTPEMAYSIPAILSFISSVMTLEPGDLIATGTPAGVGRLATGDIVEVEVSGVGVLRNPVR
jgi:2-keto-4-pentenoate hydratase/2-oxohepta-3-ene-1,7-dioic acid hydratase in catechol pathway